MRADTRLQARHLPSGLNSRFDDSLPTFAEYVARSRDMLGRVHAQAGTPDPEKIVEGNAPFELKPLNEASPPPCRGITSDLAGVVCQPSRMASCSIRVREGVETSPSCHQKPYSRGILLTHGLTDSPYFMRHLAEFFRENGFRVMAILLPGHGTQPGDLLDVRWQEWAKAVAWGADRLAEEADEIYLAGYSAGGALSLLHSLHDDRVRGLFLFSPALKISPRAAGANMHKLYSWLIPSGKWLDIKPDRDIYKYESFPKNAAAQMHALTKALAAGLNGRDLAIPVFTAASADDATVDTSATLRFMKRASHPSSRLVLYTTDTAHPPSGLAPEKLELVNSAIPEKRILGSAHTAIVLPPEDVHYGEQGEYVNCIHYYPDDMEKYAACLKHERLVFQGEVAESNLAAGMLRRLMYNPNYVQLKASLRRFIDQL